MRLLAGIAVAAVVAGGLWWGLRPGPMPHDAGGGPAMAVTPATFVAPPLEGEALVGKNVFDAKCAACHGENALGTDHGPPLLHPYYLPGHHGDQAFYVAAQQGVRAHHWKFGNMPPVEGVTRADIKAVITYVRTLQQANGMLH